MRFKWFIFGAITYQAVHFLIVLFSGRTLVEWTIGWGI